MCLIIFAYQAESRFPLVMAANRDEFFTRPTAEADFWPIQGDRPRKQILAGKDLQAGGTWLGITRAGRIAAVTNIRDPSQLESKPRSRGELTREFLAGSMAPEQYCRELEAHFGEFAGFNLLVGDRDSLYYVNNLERVLWRLEPGVYGLSNGLLNSDWPKVRRGRQRLQAMLESGEELLTDQLIDMMADRARAPDEELPDTGVPLELERKLSSAFIENSDRHYGTRCSTGIIMEPTNIRFSEQNYDEDGSATARHFYEIGS